MKILLYTIVLSVLSVGTEQVKVDSSTQLRSYNHRPSLAMKKETQLKYLAKVSKEEVEKIAKDICNEKVKSMSLTHKGQLLFYRVDTQNCKLEINALDAAIISKIKRKSK